MKSRLFDKFDVTDSDNSEFKSDLKLILALDSKKLHAFIAQMPAFFNARTDGDQRQLFFPCNDNYNSRFSFNITC